MASSSPDPARPGGGTGAVHALARGVAALRGGRALHTRGRFFRAAFEVVDHPDIYLGIPVLDDPGRTEVTVRLSKGASLPGPLPDVLGLAVRLPCPSTPRGHLDLLLSTAGWPKFLPFPSTGFASGVFSTLVSYRHAAGRIRFLAVSADRGRRLPADPAALVPAVEARPVRFALGIEGFQQRPTAFLTLHTPLPDDLPDDPPGGGDRISFDPVLNSHPALQLHGLLRRLRAVAYAGSRSGRQENAQDDEFPEHGTAGSSDNDWETNKSTTRQAI
ncbi:hypothetical protein ACFFMN_41460 [Planobispora siamensis]|uniref:Phosphodiesterase n=1 Tax=Planobispora siamensis TaxID=936338 RepID=A0A8J3SNL0_9ACTN|nr:hypothetical protein [Planobispora siamensis]GIH97706.1 hypothetical protein Psi01_83360 [Planobispora siamensis]